MFFDHPKKLVFVHNPKTAGRSIIRLLNLDDSESFRFAHMSSDLIRKKFYQSDWDQFFSFCIVRNPWERYISLYKFQRSPKYAALMRNNYSAMIAARFDLNDWIEFNALADQKSNWFGVDQKNWWNGVTKAYRFEQIQAACKELSDKFQVAATIPHDNASPRSEASDQMRLNDRSKAIIADMDRATIEAFHYAAD